MELSNILRSIDHKHDDSMTTAWHHSSRNSLASNEIPTRSSMMSSSDSNESSKRVKDGNYGTMGHNYAAETNEGELVKIDEFIGKFNRFHFMIFLFKTLIGVTSSIHNLGVTFFAPSNFINYSCADTSLSSNASQQISVPRYTSVKSIFEDFIYGEDRRLKHNSNFNYGTPDNLSQICNYVLPGDSTKYECTSYQYDTGIWVSTIIEEWDLVCSKSWFISLNQSLYMSGFIISLPMFGYLSDRYGRWRTLMLGAIIEVLSGLGCALSNSVAMFIVFRFMLGLANGGRSASSYLLLMEWMAPEWRMSISILSSLGWVAGYCATPWVYLYFLNFRHVHLFVCFYELIFVIWLFYLPESPRWLLVQKRFDRAYEVLLKAAKFNGQIREGEQSTAICLNVRPQVERLNESHTLDDLTDAKSVADTEWRNENAMQIGNEHSSARTGTESTPLQSSTMEEFNRKFDRLVRTVQQKEFTRSENKLNLIDLFKWKNLRKYTLIFCFVAAVNSFIYYGIALGVGDFGGDNIFISFTIAGIIELPSMAFAILCMKFLPRRMANLLIFIGTGLLCVIQIPLKYYDYQLLQQSIMMIAKLLNSSSFEVVRYQMLETFPTSIRQTAFSYCTVTGRIGSVLAPFVKELAQATYSFVPTAIYALLCAIVVLIIRSLPETKESDLPDTLLEAENFQGTDKKLQIATKMTSTSPEMSSCKCN